MADYFVEGCNPLPLPEGLGWRSVDLQNPDELEAVFVFLKDHYVTDDDDMFRFAYTKDFLAWALLAPGADKDLMLSIVQNNELVGFITAIPVTLYVHDVLHKVAEVNFLCVHPSHRSQGLCPLLFKELGRRVKEKNKEFPLELFYTGGEELPPKPYRHRISEVLYFHRSINVQKLVAIKFTYLRPRMTLNRTVKLYALPFTTTTPGLVPLIRDDCTSACEFLNNHVKQFSLRPEFTVEEFEHWFLPREGVIWSYVVKNSETHVVTDLISFHVIPSTILQSPTYNTLYAAYCWYTAASSVPLSELMKDAMVLARDNGADVFNCLAMSGYVSVFEQLKFGPGDGTLKYYSMNWECEKLEDSKIGINLL